MAETAAFDPNELGADESMQMVVVYITDMLETALTGDSADLEEFITELQLMIRQSAARQKEPTMRLSTLLSAMADSLASIDEERHRNLCEIIMGIRLQQHDVVVQKAFLEVLLNMVCSNTALLKGCVRCMITNLFPFDVPLEPTFDKNGKWVPVTSVSNLQDLIVDAIGKMVALVPALASSLPSLLESKVPFPLRHADAHCLYTRSILSMMSYPYTSAIRDQMLGLAIQHLLRLDVCIGRGYASAPGERDDGGVQDSSNGEVHGITQDDVFELDLGEPERKNEKQGAQSAAAQGSLDPSQVKKIMIAMDIIMDMIFEHFSKRCKAGQLKELWKTALWIFDSRIVGTNSARCSPFLLFYLATQDSSCCVEFTRHCLKNLQCIDMPAILRSSYAAYLTSFLSRCSLVRNEDVVDTLLVMVEECEQYARKVNQRAVERERNLFNLFEPDSNAELSHLEQHRVFYSIIQGVLYVLCYRMREILGEPGESTGPLSEKLRDLVGRRLGPLLHHVLDPMNICSSAVAVQFAHQASVLGVLHCTELIQADDLYCTDKKMDAFFPFDPYPLPESSHHLRFKETYVKWHDRKMIVKMDIMESLAKSGDENLLASSSWPKDIPNYTCDQDEDLCIDDQSFSAGLSPMSIAN